MALDRYLFLLALAVTAAYWLGHAQGFQDGINGFVAFLAWETKKAGGTLLLKLRGDGK